LWRERWPPSRSIADATCYALRLGASEWIALWKLHGGRIWRPTGFSVKRRRSREASRGRCSCRFQGPPNPSTARGMYSVCKFTNQLEHYLHRGHASRPRSAHITKKLPGRLIDLLLGCQLLLHLAGHLRGTEESSARVPSPRDLNTFVVFYAHLFALERRQPGVIRTFSSGGAFLHVRQLVWVVYSLVNSDSIGREGAVRGPGFGDEQRAWVVRFGPFL